MGLLAEGNRQRKGLVVLGEADEINSRALRGREAAEAGHGQRVRQLTGAVGTEVEEDDSIILFNRRHGLTRFALDNDGFDELVR
jgi:hypothetical protein